MKDDIKKALELFCKNEHWKGVYENAPSEPCKEFLAYMFANSTDGLDDDDMAKWDAVEEALDREDWLYLKGVVGNNPLYAKCERKVKELA